MGLAKRGVQLPPSTKLAEGDVVTITGIGKPQKMKNYKGEFLQIQTDGGLRRTTSSAIINLLTDPSTTLPVKVEVIRLKSTKSDNSFLSLKEVA